MFVSKRREQLKCTSSLHTLDRRREEQMEYSVALINIHPCCLLLAELGFPGAFDCWAGSIRMEVNSSW